MTLPPINDDELRALLETLRRVLVLTRHPDLVREVDALCRYLRSGTLNRQMIDKLLVRVFGAADKAGVMTRLAALLADDLLRTHQPNPYLSALSPVFADIVAEPADNVARLAHADWLDDIVGGDEAAFIRASIELANFEGLDRERVEGALAALSGETLARRFAALGFVTGVPADDDWMVLLEDDRVTVHIGDASGTYTRGMLAELNAPLRTWVAVGRTVLETNPLERATITDVPGLSFAVEPPGPARGWLLRARQTVGGVEHVAAREFATREELLTGVASASNELVEETHGL